MARVWWRETVATVSQVQHAPFLGLTSTSGRGSEAAGFCVSLGRGVFGNFLEFSRTSPRAFCFQTQQSTELEAVSGDPATIHTLVPLYFWRPEG